MPVTIIKSDPKAREKPCLRCGYSLRKLTDTNHCPECGLSVWLSLNQNDTLDMSSPEWLRRMAVGLWILVVASLLGAAAFAPSLVQSYRVMEFHQKLQQALREQSPDIDPTQWNSIVRAIRLPQRNIPLMRTMLLGGACAVGAYAAGLLVVTSNEKRYPDRLANYRLGARLICGLAGLAILMMGFQAINPTRDGYPEWTTRLAGVAAAALTWGYLHRIIRRMPHKMLTRISAWMIVVPLVSLGYSFIRNSDWLPNFIPLLFLPVSAGLFIWIAILLRQTARAADRNWCAETMAAPG
jgi:hypothetical protein